MNPIHTRTCILTVERDGRIDVSTYLHNPATGRRYRTPRESYHLLDWPAVIRSAPMGWREDCKIVVRGTQ